MDEFERVKAAMTARGAAWRGGYEGEEMELFREVDGEREALIVGYTGKPPHRRWWVDTWDHRRASREVDAVLEQVEAEYRKAAAKALRRAEELAAIRREVVGAHPRLTIVVRRVRPIVVHGVTHNTGRWQARCATDGGWAAGYGDDPGEAVRAVKEQMRWEVSGEG